MACFTLELHLYIKSISLILTKPRQIDEVIQVFNFFDHIIVKLQLHKRRETPKIVNVQYV